LGVYAAIVVFYSALSVFNGVKDTKKLNSMLETIQSRSGKVLDVKVATTSRGGRTGGTIAIYLITYEAGKPIYP